MDKKEIKGVIMSVLYVAGEAIETDALASLLNLQPEELGTIIDELSLQLETEESGILLYRLEEKIQLGTNKKYAVYVKEMLAPVQSVSLTNSLMETLSIIAYKQPVTRAEIDNIRGVHSNHAVQTLAERGLVKIVGRKNVLGKPALLGTTDEFLRHFGMTALSELPLVAELQSGNIDINESMKAGEN